MRRTKLVITTAADGTATAYSPTISGKIHQIEYVKDTASAGANAYAAGVDFVVTGEKTGIPVWSQSDVNASAVVAPRQPTHSQAGVAALYAAGGTAVAAPIAIASDRLKFAIAQGGNAKVGTFYVLYER